MLTSTTPVGSPRAALPIHHVPMFGSSVESDQFQLTRLPQPLFGDASDGDGGNDTASVILSGLKDVVGKFDAHNPWHMVPTCAAALVLLMASMPSMFSTDGKPVQQQMVATATQMSPAAQWLQKLELLAANTFGKIFAQSPGNALSNDRPALVVLYRGDQMTPAIQDRLFQEIARGPAMQSALQNYNVYRADLSILGGEGLKMLTEFGGGGVFPVTVPSADFGVHLALVSPTGLLKAATPRISAVGQANVEDVSAVLAQEMDAFVDAIDGNPN